MVRIALFCLSMGVSCLTAGAAEITLVSTGLFRGVLPILLPQFERASGHHVKVVVLTPGQIRERLGKGELFDVAFLASNVSMSDFAARIRGESRTDIARAFIAIAIPTGAAKLDVGTPQALRQAIGRAKAVALTDPAGGGPIGRHVQQAADRLGFGAELKSKTLPIIGGGHEVAEAVKNAQADFGITLASEIASVAGIEIGGALPTEMQLSVTGYGVVMAGARDQTAAKALIDFMLKPEAKSAIKENGLEPL
jgi:molybdate transport system substrate-binding protein